MEKRRGLFLIITAALLWSTGGVLIKVIDWDPMVINGLRSIIAFLVMAVYRHSFRLKLNKTVVLAALSLCCTNLFYVMATKWTTAANAIVFQYTAPIWVLLCSIFILKSHPSAGVYACTAVAFAGIFLVFVDQIGGGSLLGNVLALLSGVAFAGVFFINKLPGASPVDSCMAAYIMNALIGLPFYFSLKPLEPVGYGALIALGIFQLGVAYIFFCRGITQVKSVTASLISILEAVLNPVWVFLVVGEKPTPLSVVGICAALGAIAFVTVLDGREASDRPRKEA